MSQVYMLTKPNCPKCQNLKMFLKFALSNKYEKDIILVDQADDQETYLDLVKKHQILALPVLICEDDVLINCDPTPTKTFLEKYIGKK
ncbi:MAG: glutaredoxin family protein [Acholeplasmataceae bacterium]